VGHDVWFVERVEPGDLLPAGASLEASDNAAYFLQVMREFGLERSAALMLADSTATVGVPYSTLRAEIAACDVLINISGTLREAELIDRIPVRVYLDLDPVFNQLWHTEQIDMHFDGHTHFVT